MTGARTTRRLATTLLLGALGCGGGGGGDPTGPGTGATLANGSMSARIDGQPWRATFLVQATVQRNAAGQFSLLQVSGVDTTGGIATRTRQIIMTVGTPVTPTARAYPLDPEASRTTVGYSGIGQLTQAPSLWTTAVGAGSTGGRGTMTVTTLTDTRIAGTFAFTAMPASSNGAGAREQAAITEGVFDIAIGR